MQASTTICFAPSTETLLIDGAWTEASGKQNRITDVHMKVNKVRDLAFILILETSFDTILSRKLNLDDCDSTWFSSTGNG